MVVLIALDGELYDDRIQKRRIINSDIATAKIVSDVELKFVGSAKHRGTVEQGPFRAPIGVRRSIAHLLASLCQRIQPNGNTGGYR